MRSPKSPLLPRLLRLATLAAVAVAVLVWPAAWLLEGQARTVQLISAFDDAQIAANRFEYEQDPTGKDRDIAQIYGTPFGEPERILFGDEDKIVHPAEKPALVLMKKADEENAFKLETVYYMARMTSVGAAIAAFVLVLLLGFVRRRAARQAA